MFDLACLALAVTFSILASKEFRVLSAIVAFEFLACFFAYNFLLLDVRSENSSLIYLIYIFIQTCVIMMLYRYKAHRVIVGLVFLNLTYNMLTASQYVASTSYDFYSNYKFNMGFIMLLELIYMLGITGYVQRIIKAGNSNFANFGGFIFGSWRVRNGRVA